ncbi:MAG: hypothetical protein IJ816_03465 [Alloprevotella sp.]|nr:hypothetical protein [Alloprevotella sp.]
MTNNNPQQEPVESAGCLGIGASVLFPIVGIICYFVQKDTVRNPGAYLYGSLAGALIATFFHLLANA